MSRDTRRTARLLAPVLTTLLAAGAFAGPASAASGDSASSPEGEGAPLVVGHRGASGYRPEHTLASYTLAARMGADYIEPDLVLTKDGVLVSRHENEISGTTDVAAHPEFAGRRTTKTIDGTALTGWFTEDFTLAELKTLRAKERIPDLRQRNTLYDGRYEVPTFQEIVERVEELSDELGRPIGMIPELKHSTYFRSIGLPLERPLIRALRRNGLDSEDSGVIVQSFEISNLERLDQRIDNPLVQLLDSPTRQPADVVDRGGTTTYADLATPAGLEDVAEYADIVGPAKTYIVPRDAGGASQAPTSFVDDAHDKGLKVVPYTFRNENTFLPAELRRGTPANPADPADPANRPYDAAYGNAIAEYLQFFELGVDGLFSDNPDTAVEAREEFLATP